MSEKPKDPQQTLSELGITPGQKPKVSATLDTLKALEGKPPASSSSTPARVVPRLSNNSTGN
jgi:hypothetical protein